MHSFNPKGVCSKEIKFDIKDNKIFNVAFSGGCPGNVMGISKLLEGMEIEKVIDKLQGIPCGVNSTSCPDQLAIALKEFI